MTIEQRAKEISDFLGKPYDFCLARLRQGFGYLHGQVNQDWRNVDPKTDEEILEWYRNTTAYIWELSAYHLDAGFNYGGMIGGISAALKSKGVKGVLCLGDGIGDLTMKLCEDGFPATYHDLMGSQTAKFAESRFIAQGIQWQSHLTTGWTPITGIVKTYFGTTIVDLRYDAIVSLDFLEHVTDVDAWLRAIFAALKPGGWALLQNAFAIGSGPNGSIPMHLERNDKYETEYGPLMIAIGFQQEGTSNWWRKPE